MTIDKVKLAQDLHGQVMTLILTAHWKDVEAWSRDDDLTYRLKVYKCEGIQFKVYKMKVYK